MRTRGTDEQRISRDGGAASIAEAKWPQCGVSEAHRPRRSGINFLSRMDMDNSLRELGCSIESDETENQV